MPARSAWLAAREQLASFVGTSAKNLIFVENATAGMNLVADSFPLAAGDEVLLNDHEYGAVFRIWRRACEKVGATVLTAPLAMPVSSSTALVDSLFAAVTPRTRLIVVSHITSPTAIIFPVAEIVQRAKSAGISVAIDGPHAPAQVDLNLDQIGADFYTASMHKWLSAPLGSGFLHVSPAWQQQLRPAVLSWGKLPPEVPTFFGDEFFWSGTRDYSPYLAVGPAIDFLERVGIANFRQQTHALVQYARKQLLNLVESRLLSLGLTCHVPLVPDNSQWYGNMALVPLPPGNRKALQDALWTRHKIEVPIIDFSFCKPSRSPTSTIWIFFNAFFAI